MVTKIFVSQIDKTNSDGTNASDGSYIKLIDGVAVWVSDGAPAGAPGYDGSLGFQGSAGTTGYFGSTGVSGLRGPMGALGFSGSAGESGTGYTGSLGNAGYNGSLGLLGYNGSVGAAGFQGSLGYSGFIGSVGFIGSIGSSGFTGSLGEVGYKGSAGGAATGESIPFPFTYITDLSPNTYTNRANFLVTVNENANGVTFINSNTYIASNPVDNDINFAPYPAPQKFINYPKLKSYSEKFYSVNVTDSFVPLDSTNASIVKLTLAPTTGNIVTIILPTNYQYWYNQHYSIVVYIKQDSVGGRLVDWSFNNIKWAIGSGIPLAGPVLSITPNYTDIFTFTTMDNGTSWYGFFSAKGYDSI